MTALISGVSVMRLERRVSRTSRALLRNTALFAMFLLAAACGRLPSSAQDADAPQAKRAAEAPI
ncbi:MAG TPA: hypothetical protein VFR30_00955, partial [Lysobacter sp.]|nr:hypothetical protein [Lysobacter sp.]